MYTEILQCLAHCKTITSILFLLGIAVLIGCGDMESDEESTIPVNIYTVDRGSIEHKLNYMGTVSAEKEVRLFSQIPNRITLFQVDTGDRVNEGDVLAVIENKVLRETVGQAEAALQIARSNYSNIQREYQRTKRLFEENALSQQQYDRVKTQYENAESGLKQATAGLAQARENYENAFIRAPFDGIVNRRFLEAGDMALPGVPVMSIVHIENVKVSINVVEREYGAIRPNQTAVINLSTYPDTSFVGKVHKISPTLDPLSRLGTVEILFPNPNGNIIPGMFGKVAVIIDRKTDVPVIPQQAILYRVDLDNTNGVRLDQQLVRQSYVYIVQNGRAYRRDVDLGYQTAYMAEIIEGLSPGDHIVVRGQQTLFDDVPVKIVQDVTLSFHGELR